MEKKYGIALIGCGNMGGAHLDDIYTKENISVEYVCDSNEKKMELFQRKYGARQAEADYIKCIESKEVDIVIAASYPATHLDILKQCIKNGKHLICEKPMATNLDDAKEFVRLVHENPQIKVLVGYILRHNDTYNKVAEMIKGGAIGSPIIMRMAQNHHTMDWNKYLALINDTSPIIDCGVHYIDVMRWFTGAEVCDIKGIGIKTESDVPDGKYNYGLITVKLTDGSVAYYEAGWSNTMASSNIKEFVGPKGRIALVFERDRTSHQEEGDLIEYYRYPEKTYEIINLKSKRKPTGKQLDHLIEMIEKGIAAKPTVDEVYESFRLAVEADEKIKGEL